MSGFPQAVLGAMKQRSRGICEGCGAAQATEAHHRQYRSRGGPETLSNSLHLCGFGNTSGCHGIAHSSKGEARGWSIRSGYDPLIVPVFTVVDFIAGWRRHPDEGVPEQMIASDAIEYMNLIHAIREGVSV